MKKPPRGPRQRAVDFAVKQPYYGVMQLGNVTVGGHTRTQLIQAWMAGYRSAARTRRKSK